MIKELKPGDMVKTVGIYSGHKMGPYKVLSVSPSGARVTIEKPEFQTKKEVFVWRPTYGQSGAYVNDYTGILVKA